MREEGGQAAGINSPFVFARRDLSPAPGIGQHTLELLREAGLQEDAIENLREKGMIGC